jgi:hypothetical protein
MVAAPMSFDSGTDDATGAEGVSACHVPLRGASALTRRLDVSVLTRRLDAGALTRQLDGRSLTDGDENLSDPALRRTGRPNS